MIIKDLEDAKKLILGAAILGTGGGGDPGEGLNLLREALKEAQSIRIVELSNVPEDVLIVSPYYVGSTAPNLRARKQIKIPNPVAKAFEALELSVGAKIGAIVASEIGGANTAVALSIAARLGLPVIDGDLVGRAAPELHQCTAHIYNVPMYPSAIVSETGNILIVQEYSDIDDYEAIARYLSMLSGRFVAVVDTPMSKPIAEKAIVRNTLSKAFRLGATVIKARSRGENPVAKAAEVIDGWIVFRGVVEKYEWRNEGGFLKGEVLIKGVDKFSGRTLKSWIMNEHIMAWVDGKPLVMPPDLFTLLREDGEAVMNGELRAGMFVNGIASKAPEIWRTPEGLRYFGPRHFGLDYDYIPVEKLVEDAL